MDCREAREHIHAECDGELDPSISSQVSQHLRDCPGCGAYGQAMKSLKNRVRSAAIVRDFPSAEAMLERVFGEPGFGVSGGRLQFGFLRPGLLHAMAAAALIAAVLFVGMSVVKPAETTASIVMKHHRLRQVGRLLLETHANCCKDLEQWFEQHSGRPIHIPDIAYANVKVDGGYHYGHETGNSIYLAAYSIEGKPITLCVCVGPNVLAGTGRRFETAQRSGIIETGEDYTLISWQCEGALEVLITPFDEARSMEILASIRE